MDEQPLARQQGGGDACECFPSPAPLPGEVIPEEQRRGAPPAFQALDEDTLREHFAAAISQRGLWRPAVADFERAARLPGLMATHPLQPAETVQGALEIAHQVARTLAAVTGLESFSLQPASEGDAIRAALMVARRAFERTQPQRLEVIAPQEHPSLGVARDLGLRVLETARLPAGELDLDALSGLAGEATLVVIASWLGPSGRFEPNIAAAADVAHAHGALMCLDATGWRRLAGTVRARDAGADLACLPLSELSPLASGVALGVRAELTEALPLPLVGKERRGFILDTDLPRSIGRMALAPARLPEVLAAYLAIRRRGGAGL